MLRGDCEHRARHRHEGKIGRSFVSRVIEESDQTVVFQAKKEALYNIANIIKSTTKTADGTYSSILHSKVFQIELLINKMTASVRF